MNKLELIAAMTKAADITSEAAERALNSFIASVTDALKKGEQVPLLNLGTFGVKAWPARKGRNPSTGKPMDIAAMTVAYFKVSTKLKEAVRDVKPQ